MQLNKKEELQKALDELIEIAGKDGLSYGSFLFELVSKYADDETLTKMIADTREHINLLITEADKLKISRS